MHHFTARTLTGFCMLSAFGAVMMAATDARAAYIATITEVGGNVVMSGSGTINTAGLTFQAPPQGNTNSDTGFTYASAGGIGIGPSTSTQVDKYTGTISGPTGFGTTGARYPGSGSGDIIFLAKYANILDVPFGYASGSSLQSTSTFSGQTLASLGFTPGTYVWTWAQARRLTRLH